MDGIPMVSDARTHKVHVPMDSMPTSVGCGYAMAGTEMRVPTMEGIPCIECGRGWRINHLDVVTAFLNPEVDGEVYMARYVGGHP